jgi:hypothetical protein
VHRHLGGSSGYGGGGWALEACDCVSRDFRSRICRIGHCSCSRLSSGPGLQTWDWEPLQAWWRMCLALHCSLSFGGTRASTYSLVSPTYRHISRFIIVSRSLSYLIKWTSTVNLY